MNTEIIIKQNEQILKKLNLIMRVVGVKDANLEDLTDKILKKDQKKRNKIS